MSEGELYKKIRYIVRNEGIDPKADRRQIDDVLDEAKRSAPREAWEKLDPFAWMDWFEKWFGSAEGEVPK